MPKDTQAGYIIQDFRSFSSHILPSFIMKLNIKEGWHHQFLIFSWFLVIVRFNFSQLGGVYNSPAAAIYWEERFGDLFSGGQGELREKQLQV